MSLEGQVKDYKSLRALTRRNPEWDELAKDCVAFANARGGHLLIGIEEGAHEAPAKQRVPVDLVDKLRRRIGELTVNVAVGVQLHRSRPPGESILRSRFPAPRHRPPHRTGVITYGLATSVSPLSVRRFNAF